MRARERGAAAKRGVGVALRLLAASAIVAGSAAVPRAGGVATAASPPSINTVVSSGLVAWADGPVRWLLTAEELAAYRELRSDDRARAFIRDFWRRRDPSPESPLNPFADQFSQRIELADRLYGGEGGRGSLTDRGGAFILLGQPIFVRVGRRREPSVDLRRRPASGAPGTLPTRLVAFEEWGYPPAALPARLLELEPSLGKLDRVGLVFVKRGERFVLRQGRALIATAAKAAIVTP